MSTSKGSLEAYLNSINRHPLLSVEEEQRLARMARKGDRDAAEKLVVCNLRFVIKVAYQYRSYGVPMIDLIQEGNVGLMKGVEKFDPAKQVRLISYAVWWIRAYIQNHLMKQWSLVKIGTTQAQRTLFFSLEKTRRETARALGEDAADDPVLLAKLLNVKPEEVVSMQQRMGRDLSLNAPVSQDNDASLSFLDLIPGDTCIDEELIENEERSLASIRVRRALEQLKPRDRFIIEQRKMQDKPPTLSELGDFFDCSRERIRQIEMRAVKKLKEVLSENNEAE